MNRNSLQL